MRAVSLPHWTWQLYVCKYTALSSQAHHALASLQGRHLAFFYFLSINLYYVQVSSLLHHIEQGEENVRYMHIESLATYEIKFSVSNFERIKATNQPPRNRI